ncbi:MAG: riboflavin synthase [Coprococcus sp.]
MFTGIVEEIGKVKKIDKGVSSCSLAIEADKVLEGSNIGDSIAVNGVCLTVTSMAGKIFTADVMPETLRRSNLGSLSSGSYVNLERAMAANGRFGGHIVSGHIDGTGSIREFKRESNAVWVTVECSSKLLKYIIEKGSITIDGISLTVAYVDDTGFKVSVIPHTAGETTLLKHKQGDIVNIENDVIGKYVEKLLLFNEDTTSAQKQSGIDMNFLVENGFVSGRTKNGF